MLGGKREGIVLGYAGLKSRLCVPRAIIYLGKKLLTRLCNKVPLCLEDMFWAGIGEKQLHDNKQKGVD